MNYSVLVFGAIILLSIAYYLTVAHRAYVRPLVEVEVRSNAETWEAPQGIRSGL